MKFIPPKKTEDIHDEVEKSQDEPKKKTISKEMQAIIEWAKPILIIVAILVAIQLIGKVFTGQGASEVATQNATLTDLKNELDIKTNQFKDKQAQYSVTDEYSYYTGNNEEDDKIAIDFFKHICTWNNAATYEALRTEMFEEGYVETDSFMKALLPEQKVYYNTEDQKMHYSIDDNGDSMTFESLSSYPLSVDGTKKEYSGILKVSSKGVLNVEGNSEYHGYVYVHYFIEDGKCHSVEAESLLEQ